MRFVALLVAALALGALPLPGRVAAQSIRGQLVDSISRSPLSGAFLTLVDQHGVEQARGITDQMGRFGLSVPVAGSYRLRSKRIGFRPYVSPLLSLRAGETITYDAAIDPIPIALQEVVVAGDRACDVEAKGGDGASVAALWQEVREALAAVSWTSRSPAYWYDIVHFERELTPGGRRLGQDSTWHYVGYQQVPVRSAPAQQLASQGYVVAGTDDWTYFGPDADALLSDPFLHTHCFETKVGHDETEGLVGLAFIPARGRTLPDITGTLWVDRASAELRHLEFKYTRLPQRLDAPGAGGRVEFMRVPTGAWIVRDWSLRMPLAKMTRTPTGQEGMPQVYGYRESGERAFEIKTRTGTLVYRADSAAVAAAVILPPPPPPPPPPVTTVAAAAPPQDTARARPAPQPKPRNRSRDVLEADEFEGSSASDAYGLVQQYRPTWLQSRGPLNMQNASAGLVQVYVNNIRWGDASRLRDIAASDVLVMRHLSGPDATMRYGLDHAGGVIEVQTR